MTGMNRMASWVILEVSQTHCWKTLLKKENFIFSLQKYFPPQKVTQPGTNSYSFGGNCSCCKLLSTWWVSVISRQVYCLLLLEILAPTWCWFLLLVGGVLLMLPMRDEPEMHQFHTWIHPASIACNRWSMMSCACLLVTPLYAHCLQLHLPPNHSFGGTCSVLVVCNSCHFICFNNPDLNNQLRPMYNLGR